MNAKPARLAVVFLIAALAGGCGARKAPEVTVVNNSTSVLSEIQLYGDGFKQVIDRIEPGQSRTVTVSPPGPAELSMDVSTPARFISAKNVCGLEGVGGFKIQITITSDYNIETRFDLNTALP